MTTRLMYDSLDAAKIPYNAQIACWYPHDPRSSNPNVSPNTVVLTIDNTGAHPDCDILDLEPGAAWPPSVVPGWLRAHKALTGKQGTVYCNTSTYPAVPGTEPYYWWAAQWNGVGNVIPGSVAHQYADPGPYDLSSVYDDSWPPVAIPAPPPPAPTSASVNITWKAFSPAQTFSGTLSTTDGGNTWLFQNTTPPPPPPPPPAPVPVWPTVGLGSMGKLVKVVQYLLNARGLVLADDGVFGSETLAAVQHFQTTAGLKVDGIVGPNTWAKLVRTIFEGNVSPAVKAVQFLLGGLAVDGVDGPLTTHAVKVFQTAHKLTANGIVESLTWNALVNS